MTDYRKTVAALHICTEQDDSLSCTDCPYHEHYPEACRYEVSSDAADAIEALQEYLAASNDEVNHLAESNKELQAELNKQLPKLGEWKATEMYMTDECTACGFLMNWDDVPAWLFNLPHFKDRCPNCGAAMRGELYG